MGFILSILALLLMTLVHILDYFTSMIFDVKNKKWFKYIDKRNFQKAFNIDVFANYNYAEFWNLLFSKNGKNYKFGKKDETLSSCFGKKQLERSLSVGGLIMLCFINFVDVKNWLKGGHCKASIMNI